MSSPNFLSVFLFSAIIVINGIVTSSAQGGCDQSTMEKCMETLKPLLEKKDWSFATNEQYLDDSCRRFQDAVGCVNGFIDRCVPYNQKQQVRSVISGVNSFVNELCNPASSLRRGFVKHGSCFESMAPSEELCVQTLERRQKSLENAQMEQKERVQRLCCYMNDFVSCSYRATVVKCGEEAAAVMKQTTEMLLGPLSSSICPRVNADSSTCSAFSGASWIKIPGFFFLGIMVISVLKY